ncbi:hypothetical protein KP509_16G056100 [Ceratopteris richardii]|uniref:Photosystem II 10 kDa polypeptide, chloroplastic n=1 Tax=Ceratopteris richardii TaxID=49495 RepID=A0A8T2T0J3_CERRI|nr:hypothetical protein KP509_16G056100 [Ceratopteris richardii]
MAAVTAPTSTSVAGAAPAASSLRSEISGVQLRGGLPALSTRHSVVRSLKVVAGSGKKIQTKAPLGPSGENKFRGGVDASGRKATGKGVYQFSKKYGANVDGYSPIYTPEEWSASGDVYAAGPTGLAIWAVTLGALLLGGALLVYNTSALAQ